MPHTDQTDVDRTDLDADSPPPDDGKRKIVFWIALGIIVWGIVLATGDFLANHDGRRPLIIIASVVIFVGFWQAMMHMRRSDDTPKSPEPRQ